MCCEKFTSGYINFMKMKLAENIKSFRKERKMTQEQLAEGIEVSPQYVSDLERGVVGPSLATLKKICVALCVSSDQLLFSSPNSGTAALLAERCRELNQTQMSRLLKLIDLYLDTVKNP